MLAGQDSIAVTEQWDEDKGGGWRRVDQTPRSMRRADQSEITIFRMNQLCERRSQETVQYQGDRGTRATTSPIG